MEMLGLPPILKKLVMQKNGLVLLVGSTGSGKSTSLASMIEHRNKEQTGHILTIEDPIEYAFSHKKSIIGQREVGLDTLSYENALREAMREAPDLIMIGEVRDKQTMEAAITYADTGHLCLTTLHAVNANQALDRIVNFFPPEGKAQILMDLSLNLQGIVAQRLVPDVEGGRVPAVEVLINTPYVSELIKRGSVSDIKPIMEKGAASGMQTFDQSLYDLYKSERISLDDALGNADSRGNLEWQINFGGGVKSVSESSDQLVFPTEEPSKAKAAANSRKEPPVLSDPFNDEAELDSHVGFDEDFLGDEMSADEIASIDSDQSSILDDEDGEGKDSGYYDRLKSVFGDK
jgi:twitching motility protein PilU